MGLARLEQPMRQIQLVALALGVVLLGLGPATAAARPSKPRARSYVPVNFVGMNVGNAIYSRGVDPEQQFNTMVATGIGSIRVAFDWSSAQPYESWSQVPSDEASEFQGGPVPTNFSSSDTIIAMAARRGLSVLPVVLNAPSWDAAPTAEMVAAPMQFKPYVDYVKALVRRYGPHGSFWSADPQVPYRPIRQWQVWNEPDLILYWSFTPWVSTYVSLLQQTSKAIKAVDPGATVVLAGMPNYVWAYLNEIYKIRGARHAFDEVAVNPYTKYARGVITILQRVRAVMNKHGDRRKPLMATELGWPSSLNMSSQHFDFETTRQGQASKLNVLMPLIGHYRAQLGLAGFYYYTWMDFEYYGAPVFNFAGLLAYSGDGKVTAKPAYPVFRRWALRLTGCRPHGYTAKDCHRRLK
jgi:hypothetical protein